MSRVGKQPIKIPSGVTVRVEGAAVAVQGPKGNLRQALCPEVAVTVDDGAVQVQRRDDEARTRAIHGLTRKLLANMVQGVSQGFTRTLEIIGVGYRAEARGNALYLSLGYSHPIFYQLPQGVSAKVDRQVVVTLESSDRQLLGQIAAEIRALRPPEPYKGKGIKYSNEVVRRKAGKAAGAAGIVGKRMINKDKRTPRRRRQQRVRRTLSGTDTRPRLCVFRSNKHIYAQVISDQSGRTLAAASTLAGEAKGQSGSNRQAAARIGAEIAKICQERGIQQVVFDRNGYLYHGRIETLANAAREAGLKF